MFRGGKVSRMVATFSYTGGKVSSTRLKYLNNASNRRKSFAIVLPYAKPRNFPPAIHFPFTVGRVVRNFCGTKFPRQVYYRQIYYLSNYKADCIVKSHCIFLNRPATCKGCDSLQCPEL